MPRDTALSAPLGHSRSAHRAHGWCSHCPGRSPAEEVIAWRADALERQHAEDTAHDAGPAEASTAWKPCPACEDEGSLSVVTVTVRTGTGRKRAGGWAYCHNCENVPEANPRA